MKEKYDQHTFSLIIGSDNLYTLPKWKNHELLLRDYDILVYPRGSISLPQGDHSRIKLLEFPFLDISSTHIRGLIKQGRSPRYYLPDSVYKYVDEMNLYR
jgi:nicotinate-nucleotide adenylyltransferase